MLLVIMKVDRGECVKRVSSNKTIQVLFKDWARIYPYKEDKPTRFDTRLPQGIRKWHNFCPDEDLCGVVTALEDNYLTQDRDEFMAKYGSVLGYL